MQMTESANAARSMIDELDLASEDEDYDLYQALVADEAFAAACLRYQNAVIYAAHEHATEADRDARTALMRSIREHAQRVRGEVSNGQEGADA
ncbi:hypothetical protein [Halobellus rubicundus]|uniref:Uncharacterized protein n=1 Tax=Halobellus rubicundus TaxID=2996466 RepID=A0ABD5MDX1_9EURY